MQDSNLQAPCGALVFKTSSLPFGATLQLLYNIMQGLFYKASYKKRNPPGADDDDKKRRRRAKGARLSGVSRERGVRAMNVPTAGLAGEGRELAVSSLEFLLAGGASPRRGHGLSACDGDRFSTWPFFRNTDTCFGATARNSRLCGSAG